MLALLALLGSAAGAADTSIAVLAFELRDLTPMPATQEELQRTAAVAPLLREALSEQPGYRAIEIDPSAQREANPGFGYLFDHAGAAAALGMRYGAEWVIVGRVHKPSFLFAYLKARLIDVPRGRLVGEYVVEVKGAQAEATRRGVLQLAAQIERGLQAHTTPRTP